MTDAKAMEGQDFRQEVRAWLKANFPPSLTGVSGLVFQSDVHAAAASPDYQLWRQRMQEKGWGVPNWPSRYGGADMDEARIRILAEEMTAIGAFNPIRSFGTMMLGPTLLEYGNEE
ncbi:MAG: acyl-CoA dehydrogenase family protein, partial [Sphingobium sp.]